jgi:hypothetical protein
MPGPPPPGPGPPPPPPPASAHRAKTYKEQNAKAVVLRRPRWEDKFPVHARAQAGSRRLISELLPDRRGRALPRRPPGALVNLQDEDTWTPAHYACYYGHTDVLQELLLQGANPNSANLNGCGLLQFAAGQGHEQCALLLLQAGADARHQDEDRNTSASLARQLRPDRWQTLETLCLLARNLQPVLQLGCEDDAGVLCIVALVGWTVLTLRPCLPERSSPELDLPIDPSLASSAPPESRRGPRSAAGPCNLQPEPEPQLPISLASIAPPELVQSMLRRRIPALIALLRAGNMAREGVVEKRELAHRAALVMAAATAVGDGSEEILMKLFEHGGDDDADGRSVYPEGVPYSKS